MSSNLAGQYLYGRNTRPRYRSNPQSEPPHGWSGTPKREGWNSRRRRLKEKRLIQSGKPFIVCLECERKLRHIGTHITRIHGMSLREYKIKHRISLGTKFVAKDLIYTRPLNEIIEGFRPYWGDHSKNLVKGRKNIVYGLPRSDKQKQAIKRLHNTYRTPITLPIRICKQCKGEYRPKRMAINIHFCSLDCYNKWRKICVSDLG